MAKYTVCAAFIDSDNRATVTVDATSYEEACEKAVAKIDDGDVSTYQSTYDAGPTFVYGVVEGDGDPWKGAKNVPARFAEPDAFAPAHELLAIIRDAETWLEGLYESREMPAELVELFQRIAAVK